MTKRPGETGEENKKLIFMELELIGNVVFEDGMNGIAHFS